MSRLTLAGSICWLLLATSGLTLTAQEIQEAGPPSPASPEAAAASREELPREQTIYIPYEKFREIFEKPGRGVFLPYEQFQQLWQAARAKRPAERSIEAPLGVLLSEISSEALIENDVVRVTAELQVEILRRGWHELPLRLRQAAVRRISSDGQPVRLVYDARQGHKLLIHQAEEGATQVNITLEYAKSFSKSPAENSVVFESPQAAVNRWKIVIPERGVKVDIQPLIAASEENAMEGDTAEDAEETVLLAFVGAAPQVRINWTPKTEGAAGLEAIANVTTEQQVSLEESVMRTRTRLDYSILRAELASLTFDVPIGHRVTGVFDANVRRWGVETTDDRQVVTVDLYQPARGQQTLMIELERFFAGTDTVRDIPIVRAVDVSRQQGLVVIRPGDSVQIDSVERSGLLQVDPAELPSRLAGGNWSLAYRFSALPFQLTLETTPIRPKLDARLLAECYLENEQLTIELLTLLNVQQAGVFELEYQLPVGFELMSVSGQEVANTQAATVDTSQVNDGRLVVNFGRKLEGRSALLIVGRASLEALGRLEAGGAQLNYALEIPRLLTATEQKHGRLVVYAADSLRVQPGQTENLRSIALSEVFQQIPSLRQQRFPSLRPALAYHYTAADFDLPLALQRRKSHVSVRQLLTARVESGVVTYQAQFFYDILYSGVKQLRIDIPESQAALARNTTPGVREQRMQPQPADVSPGYVAWQFRSDTEFAGRVQLQLQWEEQNEELEIGGSTSVRVPRLLPQRVDRAWGQVVLTKAEALDLQPDQDISGLRPIDPQHDLMAEARVPDAARAFEFHDEWQLSVTATRYRLEDVKRTSIERGLVRMVVTRSRDVSVQALYRVRSTVQRLAIRLPTGADFDADPLRVNGQPRSLERGDEGALFIPLGNAPEETVLIELRYAVTGDFRALTPPWFPAQAPVQSAPAVQKVYLAAHLADDLVVLGSAGPWTNEADQSQYRLRPSPTPQSDEHLVSWVSEGTPVSTTQLLSFPTDGKLQLFSTLRPPAPPDGTLHLSMMRRRTLDGFLFCSICLVGLVFMRRSLQIKTVVLLLVVVFLIAVGVFFPTLAQQLLATRFVIAVCAVLLLWLAASVMGHSWFAIARRAGTSPPTAAARVAGNSPDSTSSELSSPFADAGEDKPVAAEEEGGKHEDV